MKILFILVVFLLISCKTSKIDTGTMTDENFDPDKISRYLHEKPNDSLNVEFH